MALSSAGRSIDAVRQLEATLAEFAHWPPALMATEEARWEQVAALIELTGVLAPMGRSEEALPHAQRAMAMARALAPGAANTATARRTVFLAATRLCNALDRLNRTDECIPVWHEGLDAVRSLAAADPKDLRLRVDVAVAYHGLALLQAKQQRLSQAAEAIAASLATWESVLAASPDTKGDRFNYASALSAKAEIEHERGNFQAGIEAHRQALTVFAEPEVAAKDPVEPLIAHEAFGDTLSAFARRGGGPEAARQARAAYQTARAGYARLRQAGQMAEAVKELDARVAQKLSRVPASPATLPPVRR
ncbi:MAG: hypothetical protein IT181_06235 [Acidobacteria bacterium]|nr:hypothetical protein [Acidobacteriota bacterium]